MASVIPMLLGGLVVFLYAITKLSSTLEKLFTDKAKKLLNRFVGNIFSAVVLGTLVTIVLDSSSAVIILTIVFINAKSINFKQAIGIIMGANIGTTFSSQIIALDVGKFSVIPLLIGMLAYIFSKPGRLKQGGEVALYFGMLFFGLFIMEDSVGPLKNSLRFKNWIAGLESPLQGAAVGGLVTLIIQSSSATVGLALVLAKQNLISLAGGIAVMLGAELGTCSDTLLATINGSRVALRAGVFHLLFNLVSIVLGLLLFSPFVSMIERITRSNALEAQLANAHMLFNIGGVLLLLPFAGYVANWFVRLIPDRAVSPAPVLKP